MKHSKLNYKGYRIEKRTDVESHCAIIYKGDNLIKCIAGAILEDGTENAINKAKKYINKNL